MTERAGPVLALVDSGTSRTRLRLVDGQQVVWQGERPVGARDVARAGDAGVLRVALAALLDEARAHIRVEALLCSGMITSNVGLLEVPHVPAPAGVTELASGLVRADFPEFGVPCSLIPGIKTVPEVLNWDTLHEADVLRGEEVEVLGLRALFGLGRATFLHLGSHPKRIDLDGTGRVTGSRTALSGELAAVLATDTVLSGSVWPPEQWTELSEQFWRRGLNAARTHGIGRALFMVRLGQLMLGASREELSAYLLGVVSALTLDLLQPAGDMPLLLYGPPQLSTWLADEAGALSWSEVQVVGPEQLLEATLIGARRILDAWTHLNGDDHA